MFDSIEGQPAAATTTKTKTTTLNKKELNEKDPSGGIKEKRMEMELLKMMGKKRCFKFFLAIF